MKIALFVPSWPPGSSANGIVTYAAQIVPALRQLGHEVFVLTPNSTASASDRYTVDLNSIPTPNSIRQRLKSRIFPEQSLYDSFTEKLLSAIVMLKENCSVDVMEMEESFGWSLKVAQAKLIPLVVRLHGPWFLSAGVVTSVRSLDQRRISLEGLGIDAATIVTAPSADVLRKVRTHYDLPVHRARIIPNPIAMGPDSSAWQLGACDRSQMLFVGRFNRQKGGDVVLRAFATLAERNPGLRLCFVGPDDGICDNNGNKLSFIRFVENNFNESCRNQIEFRGQLPHTEAMSLRRLHFLTIVASQFETFSYAVLEAMSYGCPVIASKVGGIPELIADGRNGLLFESQNVAELAAACQRLLSDHALAASLGFQARLDCARSFNAKRIAAETLAAYQSAIEFSKS